MNHIPQAGWHGTLWMICSAVLFSLMSVLVRVAADEYGANSWLTAEVRFVVCIVLVYAVSFWRREPLRFVNRRWLVSRGLFGGLSASIYFYSITKIGIGKSTIFTYTYPLWAALLAPLLLQERIKLGVLAAVVASFGGLYLIIVPPGGLGHISWFDLVAITGGLFAGWAILSIKKLHETDTSRAIIFSPELFRVLHRRGAVACARVRVGMAGLGRPDRRGTRRGRCPAPDDPRLSVHRGDRRVASLHVDAGDERRARPPRLSRGGDRALADRLRHRPFGVHVCRHSPEDAGGRSRKLNGRGRTNAMNSKSGKLDNPVAVVGELAKRLHARYGDDILPVFSEVLTEYGYHIGVKLAKGMAGLSFTERVIRWLDMFLRTGEAVIVRQDDRGVVIAGYRCPFNLEAGDRALCRALMAIDTGLIGALAEGGSELIIEKSLVNGDGCCLISFLREPS